MADNILGFIATIDVTDLKAGLSQVKKAISQTKSEFDASTAGLENWQKSSEGVSAKLTQLNTQLKAQEKAVEAYQNEINRVSNLEGDHSKQLETLRAKLTKAESSVSKTRVQINKYAKSYDELTEKEEKENSENTKLLKSLDENKKKLATLESRYKSAILTHGKYSKETKDVESQIKKTSKEITSQEKLVKKLNASYGELTSTSSALSTVSAAITAGISKLGSKINDFLDALISTSDDTETYRKNQARLANTFNDVGLSAESLTDNYNKLFSVIADDDKITEALSYLAQLGVSEQDLSKYTDTLIGVYAKFGDAIPISELSQNINEAIKTGEVTGQLSDAIKQVGEDEETFKNFLALCTSEEQRQSLILTTLDKNYKQLGQAYIDNNQSIIESNNSQREYNENLAELGEVGDDVKSALVDFKNKALEKILPLIKTTINFVSNNLKTVTAVGVVVGGLATSFTLATKAVEGYNSVVKIGSALQTIFNNLVKANPLGLLITTATAVATAGVLIYKNWDKVKSFFVGFWQSISSFVEPIKDGLAKVFNTENITELWNNLVDFFKALPSKIAEFFKAIPEKLTSFFSDAWEGIKSVFTDPGAFFETLVNNIIGFFKDVPKKLVNIFSEAWEGIKDGWKKFLNWLGVQNADVTATATLKETTQQDEEVIQKLLNSNKTTDEKETQERENVIKQIKVDYQIDDSQFQALFEKVNGNIIELQAQLEEWGSSGLGFEEYFSKLETRHSQSLTTQETALQASAQTQMSSYDEIAQRALDDLETILNAELANAQNEEVTNAIKAKYQSTFDNIKSAYDNYVAKGNEANEQVLQSFARIKNQLDQGTKETTENFSSSFKQTMSKVQQEVSKYASQIASAFSSITGIISDFYQYEIDQLDSEWSKFTEELDAKQKAFEEEQEAEIEAIEKRYEEEEEIRNNALQEELDANAQAYKDGKISDKEYFLNKYKIEEKYNTKAEKDAKEKDNAITASNTAVTNYAKQLEDEKLAKEKEILAEKNRLAEKQFKAEKANQIAQVWINAATATLACFAQLGPIGGAIAAAIVAGVAIAQTALIAKQQYEPITALATGGVVDEPTYALVGEAGKEAVMPLENNTGWINELAEQLNTLMEKDFNVDNYGVQPNGAIYYYGDTINNYNYDQTINSPKSLTRAEIYRDSKNLLSLKKY